MKRYFILFFVLILSFQLFAQLEVKKGSFKKIEGFVNNNEEKQTDDNERPYSVLIIKTENINGQQRRELNFQGDARTFFEIEYKEGEMWLYISYYATYLKISHEDLSSIEFEFPLEMEPKCGYEMTLVNKTAAKIKPNSGIVDVVSSPSGATIQIDGKDYGLTPKIITDLPLGNHVLSLSKKGCETVTRSITVDLENKLNIHEKLYTGREIPISSDGVGDNVYVDGKHVGVTPVTVMMCVGSHEVKVTRELRERKRDITIAQNGGDTSVQVSFKVENRTVTVNGVSFEMIAIPCGTFTMGTDDKNVKEEERPAHQVTLNDFSIGKYEVTQRLWVAVMGSNPVTDETKGKDIPVHNMNWYEIQDFIAKLNQMTGLNFRLPTEAEWEYAARGKGEYKTAKLGDVAWYEDKTIIGEKKWKKYRPHPVGKKKPNAYGLYDMLGNIIEWCQDWYGKYSKSPQTNPKGPAKGEFRVARGGGCTCSSYFCTVTYRFHGDPAMKQHGVGFRLAMDF